MKPCMKNLKHDQTATFTSILKGSLTNILAHLICKHEICICMTTPTERVVFTCLLKYSYSQHKKTAQQGLTFIKRYDVCWRPYEASVNSSMQCDSLILFPYSEDGLCTYTAMLRILAVCAHGVLWVHTLYAFFFLTFVSISIAIMIESVSMQHHAAGFVMHIKSQIQITCRSLHSVKSSTV